MTYEVSDRYSEAPAASDAQLDGGVNVSPDWQNFFNEQYDAEEFVQSWLTVQSQLFHDVEMSCVVLKRAGRFKRVAHWPEDIEVEKFRFNFDEPTKRVLKDQQPQVLSDESTGLSAVAIPLKDEDKLYGVVVLLVKNGDRSYLNSVSRQLRWGSGWLLNHLMYQSESFSKFRARLGLAFKLATLALDQHNFKAAAYAVTSEWCSQMGLDRVSIGYVVKSSLRLFSISNHASFDKKTNAIADILAAMQEAIDQKSLVLYPTKSLLDVNRAQKKLLKNEMGSVCSIPILVQKESKSSITGAITLEHADPSYFNDEQILRCEQISSVIGPLLEILRKEDRWIGAKIADNFRDSLAGIFGPKYIFHKLFIALTAVFLGVLSIVEIDYRVSAKASIEGWTQRHISAPIDGYILDSFVKAGDVVQKGDPLFILDNRDLLLEQLKWLNKYEQLKNQYVASMVQRDSSKAGIFQAQLDQAKAQLDLLAKQLERTNSVAPFDAIVIEGDLFKKHGAPVKRGETLFQIAPLDQYRIILEVSEREVANVLEGQAGRLKLTALTDGKLPFTVSKVTPVAVAVAGDNVFRIEAKLNNGNESSRLRPGMQGTGKVVVGPRRILWIWTHSFTEWLRMWVWGWWP